MENTEAREFATEPMTLAGPQDDANEAEVGRATEDPETEADAGETDGQEAREPASQPRASLPALVASGAVPRAPKLDPVAAAPDATSTTRAASTTSNMARTARKGRRKPSFDLETTSEVLLKSKSLIRTDWGGAADPGPVVAAKLAELGVPGASTQLIAAVITIVERQVEGCRKRQFPRIDEAIRRLDPVAGKVAAPAPAALGMAAAATTPAASAPENAETPVEAGDEPVAGPLAPAEPAEPAPAAAEEPAATDNEVMGALLAVHSRRAI